MTRILIAEDEPAIASFIEKGLRAHGYATAVVGDGATAAAIARDDDFDLLILDLGLPDLPGLEVLRTIRGRAQRIPVIILTARDDLIVEGFDTGADDYVVKPFDPEELLARVQRLLVRSNKNHAIRPTAVEGDRRTHSGLTPRESEILELLVEGLNQAQIAQRLVISPNTVATHIQRILVKLGVHNRAQAVASAVREGLVPLGTQATLESALDVSQRRADTARPESPASAPRRRMTSVD
jgi:DNA-binding NarL/FixJ family response regulator